MISIGGLELNPSMIWVERGESYGLVQRRVDLLGGRTKFLQRKLLTGRPITLLALEDQGWLDYSMVDTLIVMSMEPVAYPLIIGSYYTDIVFDSSKAKAVAFKALVQRAVQFPTDPCYGSISLVTV